MKQPIFTSEEKFQIRQALSIWRNIITTGCHVLSVEDVRRIGTEAAARHHASIKPLSTEQMRLVVALDDLFNKVGV